MIYYAAKAIIFNPQDHPMEILLGQRMITRSYEPLGGKLEKKETFEEALHREILEEAGFHVKITKCLGSYKFQWHTNPDNWSICVLFQCHTRGSHINLHRAHERDTNELFIKPEWISLKNLENIPIDDTQKEWIKIVKNTWI